MSEQNGDTYIVNDRNLFLDNIRKALYSGFGKEAENDEEVMFLLHELEQNNQDMTELNQTLSLEECTIISEPFFTKQKNKNTGAVRYLMSTENFDEFITALNDRLVSNLLASLVKKGLVESAYDTEQNDFIFWVTDEVQEEIEKKNEEN